MHTFNHLNGRWVTLQPGRIICSLWDDTLLGRNLLPHFGIGVKPCTLCGNLQLSEYFENYIKHLTIRFVYYQKNRVKCAFLFLMECSTNDTVACSATDLRHA